MKRIAGVLAKLVGPQERRAAAVELAHDLGVRYAMIFVPDPAVDLHMPAPGFPQTLQRGALWHAFVGQSVSDGRHDATLPYTDGVWHQAWGFAAADGSVLVLLGGLPDMAATEDALSMLPLVAAAFRGEAGATSGEVAADNAVKIAQQTAALAQQLERTRRELLEALMQREAAQRRSEEARALLDTILDNAPVGFCFRGADLAYVRTNPAFDAMTGASVSQLRDQPLAEFAPGIALETEPLLRDVLATGKPVTGVEVSGGTRAHDGGKQSWLANFYRVDGADGKPLGVGGFIADITERKKVEDALREREEVLREQKSVLQALMEGAPLAAILATLAAFAQRYAPGSMCGILLLDPGGTTLRWAASAQLPEAFCREATFLHAYEQQFHGHVVRSRQRSITAEIGRDPLWARAKALTERFGFVSCCSTPIISSTGEVLGMFDLYYDHVHRPEPEELRLVDLAVQLAAVSIERRYAEEDSTQKVRQLIRNMTEGVVAADTKGRVLILNPAAAAYLALSATAENQGIDELGMPPVLLAAFRQLLPADSADIVNLVLPLGDKFLDVTVSSAVTPEGRPNGAVALMRDITDEVRFRRLQESFVANVSHELRGPLASVSAVIQAFRDGIIAEVARPRYLDGIHAEIGRLSRLVNDLLYLSRLDAGTASLKTVALDLRVVFQSLAELYAPRCKTKGLTLLTDAPDLSVLADHDAVKQVILAFLENAVTHTPPGGTIRLVAQSDGSCVRVGVTDTGVGIPAEHLPHIWERFYKVDQARTRGAEAGVGLGLSIAREIVRRMGGDVYVDSEAGRGSVFGFLLPVVEG